MPKNSSKVFLLSDRRLRAWSTFAVSAVVLTLSACVSVPPHSVVSNKAVMVEPVSAKVDSLIELNHDQINPLVAIAPSADEDVPKQALTATTLEQLLTLNFASFNGDFPLAAQNALDSAIDTQDFRLARLATLFSLQLSDYDKASTASALWVKLKPNDIDAQNMNIIALVGAAKTEQAKRAIDLQRQGQVMDDYIKQVAALLVRQKNAEAGFDVIDHLVESHPKSAQVHVSAAYVAEVFKRYEAAEFWANKALDLKPGWDLAAQMTVRLLQVQNRIEERSAFVREFVQQYPHSVTMRISLSSELAAKEQYAAAYDVMLAVLEDAPRNLVALQFSAALVQQLGDAKKAAYYYRRALDAEPSNDEVRWSAARLAMSEKKYITAERFLSDITAPDKLIEAEIQRAYALYEIEGIEAATRTLGLIEARNNDEYLQVAIARHYLLMRALKYEDAFIYTSDTLVYLPGNVDLLYARALVAAELNKLAIAEQDLRAVIAAEPDNANALNALGYTLADRAERLEEAKALVAQALLLRPNDAHILDSWGWVSYRLKEYETAIEYLRRAYAASPDAEIAAHLGEVLWESGDQAAALSVWRQAFSRTDDSATLNKTLKKYEVTFPRDKESVNHFSKEQ